MTDDGVAPGTGPPVHDGRGNTTQLFGESHVYDVGEPSHVDVEGESGGDGDVRA